MSKRLLSQVSVAAVLSTAAACVSLFGASPVRAAEPIVLPGANASPESITSTADGTLYVGSFADGGVTRIRPGGKPEVWIAPGASGTRSTLGVLADEKGHRLWVCSDDLSSRGLPGPSDVQGSYVKAFDLSSGREVASAKLPGAGAFCNDIAIGPDGAAYVTNSFAPVILRLDPHSGRLDTWVHDERFAPSPNGGAGLDGIAFDKKGNAIVDLFVKAEMFRVDVKDGKPAGVTRLSPSRPLKLTDAVRPSDDGSFLLIEGAGRLDRLVVDGDRATVATLKDGFNGPTGATRVGGTAWVSEGRLAEVLHPDGKPTRPFRTYPVDLAAP